MKELVLNLIYPDFMQAMVLLAGAFIAPLEHRDSWKKIYFGTLALSFALGSVLRIAYGWLENDAVRRGSLASVGLSVVVLGVPLILTYFLFRACTTISRWDAIYGTACAYAMQHSEFCIATIVGGGDGMSNGMGLVFNWVLLALLLAYVYRIVAPRIVLNGGYQVTRQKAILTFGIMMLIGIALNYPLRWIASAWDTIAYQLCLGYDLLCCQLLVILQIEQRKEIDLAVSAATEERLRQQMEEQYHLSKENINIINHKCHDLKHQISALREISSAKEREESIREIEDSVMIYDLAVKTGNRVLDTVLTEKSLLCERYHIAWTCMAEGAILNRMASVDLYTLFGNALDNAIESSRQIENEEMRNVSVIVQRRFQSAYIQIENYFEQPLRTEDGVLLSTKKDPRGHGFGVESMKRIVHKYGGTLDIETEGNIFTLSILIPTA